MVKTQKIKALPPSMREKTRYLAFEIQGKEKVSFEEFSSAFKSEFESLFGKITAARANPLNMRDRFDFDSQRGIIRMERDYVDNARAALAMITEKGMACRSIIVSGSIRKAKEKQASGG
jgi:ribonuclease P/MRP protein subunit POP5